ncbi:MAG: AbrB/MazE/SpoVT family DNA-binding domain-containing protein, partial [Candidatus Thiodiazotropha sp. (ex Dulcina madagascariensis)]|nr:AbrB/MazE/SpoVT family DNA-binding domain-containing protein [Candidatus Thiodiazotropha sp. (ex Dulcina madagascariensis)]
MHALKLRKIGSSVGVILPKEMLERLNLREGDKLYADENRNGVQLSPYDPEFETA